MYRPNRSSPRELQRKLHLVLIPEGPLLGLPLHAAYCELSGEYFFEQVASIRYALSLRTLALQQDIAPPDCSQSEFQGVVFASSSCPSKNTTQLECVRSEVDCLDETNPGRWMIHGDMGPSIADVSHFVRHHGAGNILWFVGHGGRARDSIPCGRGESLTVSRPALLLKDGALSDARMVAEGLDFRGVDLVNLSCCVLGSLNVPDTNVEIEGFLATMTLLGCRRVTSALWPLADKAAAEFAGHFIRSLNRTALNGSGVRSPHAFALALKDAVQSFRSSRDGFFDHECYWAPYTLYGLG